MQNHQERPGHENGISMSGVHQVPRGDYEVHEVPPGKYHVKEVNEEFYQVRRHRHQEWASFSVPLCPYCLQNHVWRYLVRYPVAAVIGPEFCELCQCPCRNEVKA